jgi:hypothetical protein
MEGGLENSMVKRWKEEEKIGYGREESRIGN